MNRTRAIAFTFLLCIASGARGGECASVPYFVSPWLHKTQSSILHGAEIPGDETFRFVIVGDAEEGRNMVQWPFPPHAKSIFKQHMERAQANDDPSFVIQLGDFVSRGTAENYKHLFKMLHETMRVPLFSVIGNHDRSRASPKKTADKNCYFVAFGTTNYFFDYGGYRFVLLDTSDGRVLSGQLDWLDGVLSTKKKVIVTMHVPPVYLRGRLARPNKPYHTRSKGFPGMWPSNRGFFVKGSKRLEEIITRHKVLRVYAGHIHTLAYTEHRGVRYVLSGGGGSVMYKGFPVVPGKKSPHYIVVEAGPYGVREEIVFLNGSRMRFRE